MSISIDEQIEKIRQREIREGNLYDCPEKLYAKSKQIRDIVMCEGHIVGVKGTSLSQKCLDCQFYAQTSP